ncbi:hypothetical protein ADK52_10055 [Streptomyces sp. WM6372]|uniref:hypothetical protein n=1 Tax=Streptomyces sp. WM6372 TaxID=1415555 RepID=UPI0006ADF11D|nr:hypothetical protein [Streptomyces sp. WM6372]KOU25982.1 hypothetical protein ADK52_10055 [Streptomyces sp. WM6372]
MSADLVRLAVTDTVAGQPCVVSMSHARELWDEVTEQDREQLRLIARYRFANWVRNEYGITLSEEHLDALPVAAYMA